MLDEKEIRIVELELKNELDKIDSRLERTSKTLNTFRFEVEDGFGIWKEWEKKIKKLIKDSNELWIQKYFLEGKIANLNQSKLDEFETKEDDITEDDISEDEIGRAIDEMENEDEEIDEEIDEMDD